MIECPFKIHLTNHQEMTLCMLYCKYTIDGRHWANYPDCNENNCPYLHAELLGNLIWKNE